MIFKFFQNIPCLRVYVDLTQFNSHKLWCSPEYVFHDFVGPTFKFHDSPCLESEILKFHDFQGFPRPVRTLRLIDPRSGK